MPKVKTGDRFLITDAILRVGDVVEVIDRRGLLITIKWLSDGTVVETTSLKLGNYLSSIKYSSVKDDKHLLELRLRQK